MRTRVLTSLLAAVGICIGLGCGSKGSTTKQDVVQWRGENLISMADSDIVSKFRGGEYHAKVKKGGLKMCSDGTVRFRGIVSGIQCAKNEPLKVGPSINDSQTRCRVLDIEGVDLLVDGDVEILDEESLLLAPGSIIENATEKKEPVSIARLAGGSPYSLAYCEAIEISKNGEITSRPREGGSQASAPDVQPTNDMKPSDGGGKARTRSATVTAVRQWKCPKCGRVLDKGNLGKVWNPGDPIGTVGGKATCGGCTAKYEQADVYGGMYDIEERAEQGQVAFDGTASAVAFQLSCTAPPAAADARAICEELLKKKHPKATLAKSYCIGLTDSQLPPNEAVLLYKEDVKENKLPDMGTQFDLLTGKDFSGKDVVVLFFRQ